MPYLDYPGLQRFKNKMDEKIESKIDSSEKGSAGGVAELDSNGKVLSSQLPSYVDDVLEFSSADAFPVTGEASKIYVDLNTNATYRWSGSDYVKIGSSLTLGETESTAYRGDRGKVAYNHAYAKGSAFESGLYKITTNDQGHVIMADPVVKTDITSLGIPGQDMDTRVTSSENHYVPETDATGTINANASSGAENWNVDVVSGISVNTDGRGHITGLSVSSSRIPSNPNTDTKVTNAENHYTPVRDPSSDKTAVAEGGAAGWNFDVVTGLTLQTDGKGHVTAVNVDSAKVPVNPNNYRAVQVDDVEVLSSGTTSAMNLKGGRNVTLEATGGAITVNAADTTYENKEASADGTEVSLVTTGEKALWNSKTSNLGTVTSITAGDGLTGGEIITNGTIGLNLKDSVLSAFPSVNITPIGGKQYAVGLDSDGYLSVNVPWTDTLYANLEPVVNGTDVSLVTTGDKANWNSKTSNLGTVTSVSAGIGLAGEPITESGSLKVKLKSEEVGLIDSMISANIVGRQYAVMVDKSGYLSVCVPWEDTNTTYISREAAAGGNDVSLVTTGEKYYWNSKTSNLGTVTSVTAGAGLIGGTITETGTIKANLASETQFTNSVISEGAEVSTRIYPIRLDRNGKLAVNIPWTDTTYESRMEASEGTEVSLVTSGEKYTWNHKIDQSSIGVSGGVASLDLSGRVPASQLPSYVDDVLEYETVDLFPIVGENDKIYVALDTRLTYRWSGSVYVEISQSVALGETHETAYYGDLGAIAYSHATAKGSAFASGLYKITTNAQGHVTAATAVVKADITSLGIPESDTTYPNLNAAEGGTNVSLVTTGEKYMWGHKADRAEVWVDEANGILHIMTDPNATPYDPNAEEQEPEE